MASHKLRTPPSTLPFAEADLRAGYQTATIPAGTLVWTPPTTDDYLVDLQWTERAQRLRVMGRAGQRIKLINGYWNITGAPGAGSYGYGGIGFRANDATGAEHISLTNALITGEALADGIVFDATDNTKVTIQRTRVEAASVVTGTKAQWGLNGSAQEHLDGLQVQGNIGAIEIGLSTFYTCAVQPLNDGGKGLMLGGGWGPYTVALNKVNFRDTPGMDGQGAFIFQDDLDCPITFTDVYAKVAKTGTQYLWENGSSLFLAYNNGSGGFPWTSSGTAPNRVASFSATGWTGTVQEGYSPSGDDYCTRAMLGF